MSRGLELSSETRSYVENLTKIGLAFILKEPLKWRNSLIVEMMSKLGCLGKQGVDDEANGVMHSNSTQDCVGGNDIALKVNSLEVVRAGVRKPMVEAVHAYLQTFRGVVLHPSLRSIMEACWPDELKKIQEEYYSQDLNIDYDGTGDGMGCSGENGSGSSSSANMYMGSFQFNPGYFVQQN